MWLPSSKLNSEERHLNPILKKLKFYYLGVEVDNEIFRASYNRGMFMDMIYDDKLF